MVIGAPSPVRKMMQDITHEKSFELKNNKLRNDDIAQSLMWGMPALLSRGKLYLVESISTAKVRGL